MRNESQAPQKASSRELEVIRELEFLKIQISMLEENCSSLESRLKPLITYKDEPKCGAVSEEVHICDHAFQIKSFATSLGKVNTTLFEILMNLQI